MDEKSKTSNLIKNTIFLRLEKGETRVGKEGHGKRSGVVDGGDNAPE